MDYSSEVRRRFGLVLAGAAAAPMAGAVCGEAGDRTLNTWVRFSLEVDGQRIRAARFQIFGCPEAIAAAHLIAERLAGHELDKPPPLDMRGIATELDIPVQKLGKLLLVEDAVTACWRETAGRAGSTNMAMDA